MQYESPKIESQQAVQALLNGWGPKPGQGGGKPGHHS